MSCILKTSTAKGDDAWLCTYLAAGATQPDKLVLRIMGHEHLDSEGHGYISGSQTGAEEEKKIKIAYEVN